MEKKHVSKQKNIMLYDDALWVKIERYFPHAKGKRKYKQRDVFNVCLFIIKTGIQWQNLPEKYPSYNLVFFILANGNKLVLETIY